jgi:hypothetical protein
MINSQQSNISSGGIYIFYQSIPTCLGLNDLVAIVVVEYIFYQCPFCTIYL